MAERFDPADAPAVTDPPETETPETETRGAAADPPGAAADAPTAEQVAALQRERDELYDRLLRKTAEFDNYRRRLERERRQQADQAVIDLLQELLLVVDDFDLALAAESTESVSAYKRGIELIHAKLHDMLKKYGVRPIEALGSDFDPNLHQAVIHEPAGDHRDGEVIGELRRGYVIGDRLLRPSMVKVAKA
jgi:molecular chaperone GrpE